jgi:hypothetical protein
MGAGKRKPRAGRGFQIESSSRYVGGLRALGAVFDVETHGLAFSQNLESFRLDGGKVYKHVLATIGRGDEAESLGFVEPFNSSVSHFDLPLKYKVKIDQSLISKNRKTGILK